MEEPTKKQCLLCVGSSMKMQKDKINAKSTVTQKQELRK